MADSTERTDLTRGIELARQGHREAAYASLRRAIFTEGDSGDLRLWLSTVAPTTAETVQHLERAQVLEPDDPHVAQALEEARQRLAAEGQGPGPGLHLVPPYAGTEPPVPAAAPAGAWPPDANAPSAAGAAATVLAPRAVEPGAAARTNTPTYLSGMPVADTAADARAYPGTLVAPPAYGVFEEARTEAGAAPLTTPGRPPPTLAPRPPLPAPHPARAPQRRRPLLLGLIVLLALFGLVALALNSGLLTAALTGPQAPPAQLTQSAETAAAQASTAIAASAATAAQAATRTAVPAATAQAEGAFYRHEVDSLLQDLRAQDGDIANVIHQADDAVISAQEAGKQVELYTHQNTTYKMRAANLGAPTAFRAHQAQVAGAIALRAQALDFATQYIQQLNALAPALQTAQDAEAAFQEASAAYAQRATQANYVNLLRAKDALDNAQSQLTRQRTYADQDHQQFLTLWDRYHAALPDSPQ